jgi:hypothetical protein
LEPIIDSSYEENLFVQAGPALEEAALIINVEAVALIAHITSDCAPLNATICYDQRFTLTL